MAGYLTIAAPSEGYVTEKMSRFLAFAFPVTSVEEAMDQIKQMTNRYHDARHVCWAYMVGPERTQYRSSDNGEPSGTAGKPILGQINSLELSDVLVVVVRYFGGIKLGTPGLIAAYRAAARQALDAAQIIERRPMSALTLTFPYVAMEGVMKLVKGDEEISIAEREMNNTCRFTLSVPTDRVDEIRTSISHIEGVSLNI